MSEKLLQHTGEEVMFQISTNHRTFSKRRDMTNIIETTYKTLANTGELDLTEKEYSTNYLGRCKSYYAYLKSTGKQPSTEVLLQLWTQLRLAEKQEKTKNKSKHYFFKKRQPNQFQKTTLEMSNKVLDELIARSTVCCTPPNPPCNQLN